MDAWRRLYSRPLLSRHLRSSWSGHFCDKRPWMVQLLPLNAERLTRRTLNRLLPAAVALCLAAGLVGCQQSGRFAQGGVGANVYGAPVASDTLEQSRVPA